MNYNRKKLFRLLIANGITSINITRILDIIEEQLGVGEECTCGLVVPPNHFRSCPLYVKEEKPSLPPLPQRLNLCVPFPENNTDENIRIGKAVDQLRDYVEALSKNI